MYKNYSFTEEAYIKHKHRVDKKIKTFNYRYMNNSKWKKLFITIFANTEIIQWCEVVDFFSSSVILTKTTAQNSKPEQYIYNNCIDDYLVTAESR